MGRAIYETDELSRARYSELEITSPATMIQSSPIASVLTDPLQHDNPIIECNVAFERLTGFGYEEIVGRNCRFLSGPGTASVSIETLRTAVREGRPAMVEIINYKKDRTLFRNALLVTPLFGANGQLKYFYGSQVEILNVRGDKLDRRTTARQQVDALPRRQREVIMKIAMGKPNKQIAYDLSITERTVKMHRAALMTSLNVTASADLIRIAFEAGF